MKGAYVFVLLLAAIATATELHIHKNDSQGERIDRLSAGLKEVKDHLPPGSNVTFRITSSALNSDEYILWRYLLAPRYCSILPKENFDTVLAIAKVNSGDTAMNIAGEGRKLIFSSTDGEYNYQLTSNSK